VPGKPKQAVIKIKIVDINRLDSRRANRKCVKIPHGQIAKGITFETKISPEVFSGGVAEHNLPADCQQNWTMKDCQKRQAYGKPHRRLAAHRPPASIYPRLCLTVLGHYSQSIST
jgi:hypothetical protein